MNNDDERDSAEEESQTTMVRRDEVSELAAERMREDGFRFVESHSLRSDTEDVRTNGLWESLLALMFGHMVPLTDGIVKYYRGDLFNDARWLLEYVRDEMTFYYAVRESGTSIGTEREEVSYIGYVHLYRFDLLKSSRTYGESWYVAIGIEEVKS